MSKHACKQGTQIIALVCDHEKRLVDDCRECEALSDRAHEEIVEYWQARSGLFV